MAVTISQALQHTTLKLLAGQIKATECMAHYILELATAETKAGLLGEIPNNARIEASLIELRKQTIILDKLSKLSLISGTMEMSRADDLGQQYIEDLCHDAIERISKIWGSM